MIRPCFALLAGLLVAATPAHAQFPATYAGAAVLPVNGHVFGAYVPMTSNSIGALAQLRLSFLPAVDFGFQGGISRLDRSAGSRTLVRLGTDVKFQVVAPDEASPIAVSVGAGLGVFSGDDYNVLALGPNLVVSRSWQRGEAGEFTPYAGLGLSFSTNNIGPDNRNDFSIPVRVGAEFGITAAARLVFDISNRLGSDFGDDTEFALGANLPF